MATFLLRSIPIAVIFAACSSGARVQKQPDMPYAPDPSDTVQPALAAGQLPQSLMDLPQSQYGGFILKPGFYEAEFKTYCLQPGTPDPSPRDAYLQGPLAGYRKDMIETALVNSARYPDISQRNVQLLLWSMVSRSDFNKLSPAVRSDAMRLLTPQQVFELKGGIMGLVKTVSNATGVINVNSDMQRLFEQASSSYEAFERIAVLREPSQIKRTDVKYDQWYRQKENYYVRYFPASYQKVKIQVYVPADLFDAEGKRNGKYIVFDPTGKQAIPAFTNAQRLGIGGPVIDIVRVIIEVSNQDPPPPKRGPKPKQSPKQRKGVS